MITPEELLKIKTDREFISLSEIEKLLKQTAVAEERAIVVFYKISEKDIKKLRKLGFDLTYNTMIKTAWIIKW